MLHLAAVTVPSGWFLDRIPCSSCGAGLQRLGRCGVTDTRVLTPCATHVRCGADQVLLTYKGQNIAVVEVESKWVPNKVLETRLCYGTASLEHPGTLMVATERGKYYLGGKVVGLELPRR